MAKVLWWSRGYRAEHWIRVLSIALLVLTGFYIHWPFVAGSEDTFVMGTMRWIHFVSAYVLILGLIVRIYMAFASRFDADYREFGWTNIKRFPSELAYYLFMRPEPPETRRYNPMQALTYLIIGVLIIIEALTGFALYKGQVLGLFNSAAAFVWVNDLLGGESATRIWHFLIMWIIISFVAIHVYIGLVVTYWNKDDTMRSMITGYKNQ